MLPGPVASAVDFAVDVDLPTVASPTDESSPVPARSPLHSAPSLHVAAPPFRPAAVRASQILPARLPAQQMMVTLGGCCRPRRRHCLCHPRHRHPPPIADKRHQWHATPDVQPQERGTLCYEANQIAQHLCFASRAPLAPRKRGRTVQFLSVRAPLRNSALHLHRYR